MPEQLYYSNNLSRSQVCIHISPEGIALCQKVRYNVKPGSLRCYPSNHQQGRYIYSLDNRTTFIFKYALCLVKISMNSYTAIYCTLGQVTLNAMLIN